MAKKCAAILFIRRAVVLFFSPCCVGNSLRMVHFTTFNRYHPRTKKEWSRRKLSPIEGAESKRICNMNYSHGVVLLLSLSVHYYANTVGYLPANCHARRSFAISIQQHKIANRQNYSKKLKCHATACAMCIDDVNVSHFGWVFGVFNVRSWRQLCDTNEILVGFLFTNGKVACVDTENNELKETVKFCQTEKTHSLFNAYKREFINRKKICCHSYFVWREMWTNSFF